MAINKLSITQVGVNQGLAQIKTGEFFIVTALDLNANKATLVSTSGDEKIVSKATLERWYRELSGAEVVELGKLLKSNSDGSEESVIQESNESASTAEPDKVEDANGGEAGIEDSAGADTAAEGSVSAATEASSGNSNDERPADLADGRTGDHVDSVDAGSGETGGVGEVAHPDMRGTIRSGEESGETIHAPITPSNAGKDKDKAKTPKKQEPKNAALMKVRQTIIDTIMADSPSIQLKKTTSYDVLKEKHNFAEITHGSNRFNVSVMSKCLTPDQINKVKVNPASFGWSIDADFTVFDESDIEMAVQLIRQSREYRLANPVTRRKKEAAPAKK